MGDWTPYEDASDEPLSAIEDNECTGYPDLVTVRFQRLFNEIHALRDANEELCRALEHIRPHLGFGKKGVALADIADAALSKAKGQPHE